VLINDNESVRKVLKYAVPQGSKLGTVLFNAYTAPLSKVAEKFNIIDQKYADDEQLILSFKPGSKINEDQAIFNMESCIIDIRKFLHDNKLCNNSDKTEFMLIGSKHNLMKINCNSLKVDRSKIDVSDNVKNLGVMFDKLMSMDAQVKNMCKKVFLNIKNIAHIRSSLSKSDTKTAVHALVTPHLDYGNALLSGITEKNLNKLQVAQNSAARLIERLKKNDRISHIRKELHWLPIKARIEFKILNITWKTLNNQSPSYLADLLNCIDHHRNLRSNQLKLLKIPRTGTSYGDRAFSSVAPKLWNSMPTNIHECDTHTAFRSKLKTYLFHNYYIDP
jgi:hypothetical protein